MVLECAREEGEAEEDELGSLADIVDVDALSESAPPVFLLEEEEGLVIQD